MPGVALDQNQEIHIRGEHAGIQYQYENGIPLPLDINNDPTFTQLLNSYFVKSVSLIDGVLPMAIGLPGLSRSTLRTVSPSAPQQRRDRRRKRHRRF